MLLREFGKIKLENAKIYIESSCKLMSVLVLCTQVNMMLVILL
jgi:hypothetical protein